MPNTSYQSLLKGNNGISSGEWRVIIALLMIFPLGILNTVFFNSNAYAFPANTPACSQSSTHCYGVIDWPNHINGAWTDVYVRSLASGGNAITHEMWMTDLNSNLAEECYIVAHASYTNGPCWVEGGYVIEGPDSGFKQGEFWYWADVRPGGEGYSVHYDPTALQSGDYNTTAEIYIFNAQHNIEHWSFCPNTYDEWCVIVSGNSSSWSGVSGNGNSNWMYPNQIQIGLEYIAGNGSASSGNASFTDNAWQSSQNDSFNYQKTYESPSDGQIPPKSPDYPVKACWLTPPNESSTGGNFLTYLYPTGSGC